MADETDPFQHIDWHKAQQQYLDALGSFLGEMRPAGHADAVTAPWASAFASGQPSESSTDAKERRDVFANLLEQSQVFYSMTEQFSGLLKELSEVPQESDAWQGVLDDHFEKMKQQFSQPFHAGRADMAGLWQAPLQKWLRAFSSESAFPRSFLAPQARPGFPDPAAFFSTPFSTVFSNLGAGPAREYQEGMQHNAELWQACLENYHEYERVLSGIGRDAIDGLHEEIRHIAGRGEQISSLRELYDLWIKAQEAAYARTVFTEEYSELYGRLLNSLMASKRHNQAMFAQLFSALHLPTHAQMASMAEAQQALSRDLRLIQQQQGAQKSELAALQKDLEEIRRRLAETQAGTEHKRT